MLSVASQRAKFMLAPAKTLLYEEKQETIAASLTPTGRDGLDAIAVSLVTEVFPDIAELVKAALFLNGVDCPRVFKERSKKETDYLKKAGL